MAPRLSPLDDVLGPVLARIGPADAQDLPLRAALGGFAARDIHASHASPPSAIARVAGYAVASDDTLGASAHEPMPIMAAQKLGRGMPLPAGTNAVVQADLIEVSGGVFHILGSVSPGEGVRFAGHDLAAGALIIRAGEQVTAQHVAVLDALGVTSVSARQPRVALEGDGAARLWLESMFDAAGAIFTTPDSARLHVVLHADLPPSLALQPGDGTRLALVNGAIKLDCAAQLEGAVAAFFAVALPVLARLAGATIRHETCVLSRGVRSAIGLSEIALFRGDEDDNADPLICGQITLEALLAATHIAIVPPGFEGYAAGTSVRMLPLAAPL